MPHQSGTSVVLATLRRMLLVVFVCMLALTACRKGNDTTNQAPTATPGSSGEESSGNNTGGNQPSGSSGQNAELPTPGILVSAVTGNTAALNAVAEFSVQLDSVPTADVTISVASSNEGEGVAEQSELIFTPENWFQPQVVVVRGTNDNVVNGEQNYQILLGAAASADPLYNGLDPEDVALRGIELSLTAPDDLTSFVANVPTTIQPTVRYTGDNLLSFALTQAPEGMTIDLSSGLISWAPQDADEGQTFSVGVSVNDGNKFAEFNFDVTVVAPIPLAVEIEGNILRVVDESSSLNGMTITQLEGENVLSQLNLGRLSYENAPQLPEWVTALSDVFVVRGSFDQDVELRFPLDDLPEGVSLSDVNLHAFIEALDAEGQFWSPVFIEIQYEGTSDAPIIVVRLGGLEGFSVWGYGTPEADRLSSSDSGVKGTVPARLANTPPLQNSPTCTQQKGPAPEEALLDKYVCAAAQVISTQTVTSTITITGWGLIKETTHWSGMTMDQLVSHLLAAQVWFSNHQLGFDKEFNVAIHAMDDPSTFGYVTTGNFEQRKTLHLTNKDSWPSTTIQGTIVHEYFHHAQGHPDTRMENKGLLIDGSQSAWIIEGTARWFEDQLFDNLNTYTSKEGSGQRIAEAGMNRAQYGSGTQRPYQRFSFFKLLTKSCPQFESNFRAFLNGDLSEDQSGIKNLTTLLDDFGCNFGGHFGADKVATLEAALAYYNYTTQFEDKISLLDANEADTGFRFDKPNYSFSGYWSSVDLWVASGKTVDLRNVANIPAVGAYSFRVPAVTGQLPAGKVAELIIDSDQAVFVSITSADGQFNGTNTIGNHAHSWFSTTNQASYIYDANGNVPGLFVTLVNPGLDNRAIVKVSFQIRDVFTTQPAITSHVTGDQVSNRVITIAGEIPTEARGTTTTVVLTVNGIATNVPMNSDGSYSAQAVVALGQNIIKVQGFNGATPTTNVNVITLQGVESGAGGRNALIASRAVFVLRWDTNGTDIDIYSTDKNNATIWYNNLAIGPGNLDFDVQTGFGPEVVSYRVTGDNVGDLYINGSFELDVHYYSGSLPTHFTLDVILNETDGDNRRVLRFESVTPLPAGNSNENIPEGAGASRFNNIVRIVCSAEGVCSLAANGYDSNILIEYGRAEPQ